MEDNYVNNNPRKLFRSKSIESMDVSFSTTSEYDIKSLDLSTHVNSSDLEDMKIELIKLKQQLWSTQSELDYFILENSDLKKEIKGFKHQISLLKSLCKNPTTPSKRNTPARKSKPTDNKNDTNISSFAIKKQVDNIPIFAKDNTEKLIPNKQDNNVLATNNTTKVNNSLPNSEDLVIKLAQNDSLPTNLNNTKDQPKNIIIIGSTQCRGLASQLIISRKNSKYDKYKIQGLTYSEAPTEVLTSSCDALQLNQEDKLVLCVGEEDSDPQRLSHELYYILKRTKASVLLLSVCKNRYLNEKCLNNLLQCVSNKFKHCHFIKPGLYNKHSYIRNICSKINLAVDTIDYNNKFIPCKGKGFRNTNTISYDSFEYKNPCKIHRQKTITEYFPTLKTISVRTNSTHSINCSKQDGTYTATENFFRL